MLGSLFEGKSLIFYALLSIVQCSLVWKKWESKWEILSSHHSKPQERPKCASAEGKGRAKMVKCYSWKGITSSKVSFICKVRTKKILLKEAQEIAYWFQISFCSTTFVSQILSRTSDIGSTISRDKCVTRKFNFYQHVKNWNRSAFFRLKKFTKLSMILSSAK